MSDEATTEKYPEHAKLAAFASVSQEIGEFLDYGLPAQGIVLAEVGRDGRGRLYPTSKSITAILADYFGIDQDALEREKRAMLDELRRMNETQS